MDMRLGRDIIYRIDFAVHGSAGFASAVIRVGNPADFLCAVVAVGFYKRIKCDIVEKLGVHCNQQPPCQSQFLCRGRACNHTLRKAGALTVYLIFIDILCHWVTLAINDTPVTVFPATIMDHEHIGAIEEVLDFIEDEGDDLVTVLVDGTPELLFRPVTALIILVVPFRVDSPFALCNDSNTIFKVISIDILHDLVNKVYVCAPDKSSGHRVQDVQISLACIGFLPESIISEMVNHAVKSRTA